LELPRAGLLIYYVERAACVQRAISAAGTMCLLMLSLAAVLLLQAKRKLRLQSSGNGLTRNRTRIDQ
jgi:hypothetical protein